MNQQFKNNLYNRILECDKSNPKEFWSILKDLRESKGHQTIDPDIFFDHFQKLNSMSSVEVEDFDKTFENKVLGKLSSYNTGDHPPVPELDKIIDIEELHNTIQKLPSRKAAGGDGIINEMIKATIHELSGPLLILFNKILNEGIFPESWSQGIIVPIHKSGSLNDPNNYRGITISSCLGKLFTKLMANRLTCWLVSNNILAEQQIGFRPGCRTSDHVFVLKSIIDHMKKKRKKVFACFVDFRKAFDTVWRKGLMFKLYKWGIGTKFCSLLDNMYSQLSSCVRIGDRVTEYFISEVGTRQGCNLSPMIFNLFINDLPNLLYKANTDPIILEGKVIPILMYADDVVLLSKTSSGLNRALNVMNIYCQKWKLKINTEKTKILIFNCKKWDNFKFHLGTSLIEIRKSYTYLGFIMTPSGKFTSCIKHLGVKAKKAYNSFRFKMTPQSGCPVKVLHKLFYSIVAPIALYGAEVWGLADIKPRDNFLKHILSMKGVHANLLNSFSKFTLQVNSKTNSIASLRELGIWPFIIPIIKAAFKFYIRAKYSEHGSLLNSAFRSQVNIPNSSIYNLQHIANSLNFNLNVHISNFNSFSIKGRGLKLENEIKLCYDNISKEHIIKSSKLCLLKQVLGHYKASKYISFIRNASLRKALTHWRLSCHSLPIERGRYANIPIQERFCSKCNNRFLGDEVHALFNCNNINIQSLRAKFLTRIFQISHQLSYFDDKGKLSYFIQGHDQDIMPIVSEWFRKLDEIYAID